MLIQQIDIADYPFLTGGGRAARVIAAHDWSRTPLGPLSSWPIALRTAVGLVLNSGYPSYLTWGPDLIGIYNDAYFPILGSKPEAMGRPFAEVWSEIWADVGPIAEAAYRGEATYHDALPLTLERHGHPEETWWTFSYSPVRDDMGNVGGVLCIVTEVTKQVLTEQRLKFLVDLSDGLRTAGSPHSVTMRASRALGERLGAGRVGYGEIELGSGMIRVARDWTDGRMVSLAGEARLLDAFGSQVVDELKAGRTLVVEDYVTDPRTAGDLAAETWASIGTRSLVVTPKLDGGVLDALLYVHSAEPRRWTQSDVELIQDVAVRTWSAYDHSRAESLTRDSEERFRALAEAIDQVFYIVDLDTNQLLYLSPAYEQIWQRPGTELINDLSAFVETIHPDDRQQLIDKKSNQQRGEPTWAEYRITLPNGSIRWIDDRSFPVRTSQGRRSAGLARDITEERLSAQLVRESEARFRGVFDSSLMGFTLFDTRSGETFAVNDCFLRMTGHSRADFDEGRWDWRTFTPAEYLPDDQDAIDQVAEKGYWEPYEKEYVHTDGHRFPVRISSAPLPGQPGCVVVAVEDITTERAATAALQESEARFRTMADSAPALIWMSDANAQVIFANRHYERDFGLPPEAILQAGWRQIVHEDDIDQFFTTFMAAFERREAFVANVRVWDKHKRLRWLRCQGVPRFDETGTFLGYTGANVDITEAKLARDELERLVGERTAELANANRQLLNQIKERQKVEATLSQMQRLEAVGQLTAGVAHDFNNLLTVILGNLSFVERSAARAGLDGATINRLGHMRAAAERGANLTAQLLAFSRKQRLEARPIDLNESIKGMQHLLQSSLGGSIRLELRLAADVWPALVDPTQIELVILNLAINARDAMEDGGQITLHTSNVVLGQPERPEEPAPGEYVMVRVADTGSGMTPEVMAKVFEPFFTTKAVGKGSGLGLAQVYGFAKQSGGGVRIETSVGEGTSVMVFLPRAATRDSAAGAGKAKDETLAPLAGPRRRVLLVDDDNAVRQITAGLLEDLSCAVVQSDSGWMALDILEREAGTFSLVVADFAMPGMNGVDVARNIASRWPNLPVLFVTGYADLTALRDIGEDRIVQKPYRNDELADKVRRLLSAVEG